MNFETLKNNFFIIAGPNVIESEEHTLKMAKSLKDIFSNYDVNFIFKTSLDKANRSSLNSYRGLGFEEGLRILKKVKEELDIPIITDIHESWQAKPVSEVADIIQIPAFLCRQTDLLKAAAETGKIIHVKKGQFCSAEQMHKCKDKIIAFGNPNVILCERGNSFGYQDLVVDPRNLIWLKSDTNLVSMDITHCLQQPSQKMADGTVKSGGLRELIPYMGKMAISLGVDGIFMEVHDRPDESKCDAPTQWPLDKLEWLLGYLLLKNKFSKIKIPNLGNDPLRYCLNNDLINKNGTWIEFGVWKGQTLDLISMYTKKDIYGFDSFVGFTDHLEDTWNISNHNYSLNGNIPKFVERLDKFERKNIGTKVEFNKNVKFIKGFFDKSIPIFISEKKDLNIDFLHIDCDIYKSTKIILNNLTKYINNNCIIVFDELINYPNFINGEIKALYEWIEYNNIIFEYIGTEGGYNPDYNDHLEIKDFFKKLREKKMGSSVAIRILENKKNNQNKNNSYNVEYNSSSTDQKQTAILGTIESDTSGFIGKFDNEIVRGHKILNKLLKLQFNTILDIGAGALEHSNIFLENNKIVDICDYGNSVYYNKQDENIYNKIRNKYIGDFNTIKIDNKYDSIWCCHILEHQLNVNLFLKKIHGLLNEDGYLAIVVPPRKPFVVGGHVTIWNAGLVLYNLILAGFDCSEYCDILQYDYNIGIIIKKKTIKNLPNDLSMDKGDIEKLSKYFPFDAKHNFNGDIMKL